MGKRFTYSNLGLEETKFFIQQFNKEFNQNIPTDISQQVLILSGGNAKLTQSICISVVLLGEDIVKDNQRLSVFPLIKDQLDKLTKVIISVPINELIETGLINKNGTLFAQLLEEFLKHLDLYDLKIAQPKLTKTDRKILWTLATNLGSLVTQDQISLILNQRIATEVDWALYKAVERLRTKIKSMYQLKTIRGRGWILRKL